MKKLFLPCLFSNKTLYLHGKGAKLFIPEMEAFYTLDEAVEFAQKLSLTDPNSKVVIFEATTVIEPRKVEFAKKKFNDNGELLA